MLDLIDQCKKVEVLIRDDGKVLWVNTEHGCVLRIGKNIESIRVVDWREPRVKYPGRG